MRDVLDPNRGGGRMSRRAEREIREFQDGSHPRRHFSPMVKLEIVDEEVELAGEDEMRTHFDPEVHPRAHRRDDPDEPVCDSHGNLVDMVSDKPSIDRITVEVDDPVEDFRDIQDDSPSVDDLVAGASEPVDQLGDLMSDTDPIEAELGMMDL